MSKGKAKKIPMKRVEAFFRERKIDIVALPNRVGQFYLAVFVEAGHAKQGSAPLAQATALSRVAKDDMSNKDWGRAEAVALARGKRGLYKLLHGKKIHDPLCQGVRYE